MSDPKERPRVVFETMVVFQAAANTEGPAAELFRRLEAGQLNLYVSAEILNEMRDVLSRPKLRAKNPRITSESVHRIFVSLSRFARSVSDVPSAYSLPRDPDDEPYLNLAIAVDADHLVTWDNDLLDLMEDAGFRSHYPQLLILNPVAFLRFLSPPSEERPCSDKAAPPPPD